MPKNLFKAGNKAAEKWNVKETMKLLSKIWETLTKPDKDIAGSKTEGISPSTDLGNFVRHNDIKTLTECCLMQGVGIDWWSDIKDRYLIIRKDVASKARARNQSASVLRLMTRIESVIEARLIYGGSGMDMFVLRTKFKYSDVLQVDHSTKGGALPAAPQPQIVFIPADSLDDDQINKFLNRRADRTGNEGVSDLIGGL